MIMKMTEDLIGKMIDELMPEVKVKFHVTGRIGVKGSKARPVRVAVEEVK